MVLVDGAPQPRSHYVRVDLRRRDIRVTQHGLHASQVRSTLQQVGSEAVTNNVRRQLAGDACFPAISAQKLPETLPAQATAPACYEQKRAGAAFQQRPA